MKYRFFMRPLRMGCIVKLFNVVCDKKLFLGVFKLKKTLSVSIFALLLVFAFGQAYADYLNVEFTGMGAKETLHIWGGGFSNRSVYSGVMNFDVVSAYAGSPWTQGNSYGGFCIDIPQNVSSHAETYQVINVEQGPKPVDFLGGPMGTAKANYLRELWGRYFDHSWVGTGRFTRGQRIAAEAFGAAVWEIVYEDLPGSSAGWDVTIDGTAGSRGFKASGLNSSLANQWLHSLDGQGPMANLAVWSNDCFQDMIVEVPEPATIGILCLGTALMLFKRKQDCSA